MPLARLLTLNGGRLLRDHEEPVSLLLDASGEVIRSAIGFVEGQDDEPGFVDGQEAIQT